MPDQSQAPESGLLALYRQARYRVAAPGRELLLRVDQYDAELAKLLREAWVEGAAVLTAFNPGSRQHTPEWNEATQDALVRELTAAGHPCLAGTNESDSGDPQWIERSVLALDLTLAAAGEIAARYGQLAFVWIDTSATPRLIPTVARNT